MRSAFSLIKNSSQSAAHAIMKSRWFLPAILASLIDAKCSYHTGSLSSTVDGARVCDAVLAFVRGAGLAHTNGVFLCSSSSGNCDSLAALTSTQIASCRALLSETCRAWRT